jgi:predicted nucleotidyltransferase
MTVAQIEVPQAQIAELCQRNGIRKLALFGSVLTARFTDSSDIDILVDFQPQERVGFFRLADIEEALGRLFGGRKVDVRTPMDLSRYFRDQVVRHALVMYSDNAAPTMT